MSDACPAALAAAPVAAPAGFLPCVLDEAFLHHVGPLHQRPGQEGHHVIAFRAAPVHLNRFGVVHGGMLASLADVAIGMNAARVAAGVDDAVTLTLTVDYIEGACAGQWIEAHTVLRKRAGRVRFGDCDVLADGRLVARGHATFYVRKPAARGE